MANLSSCNVGGRKVPSSHSDPPNESAVSCFFGLNRVLVSRVGRAMFKAFAQPADYVVRFMEAATSVQADTVSTKVRFDFRVRVRPARLIPGLVFACALTAVNYQPAFTATPCMLATEKAAFDVRAMQSQLMVAALSYGKQDEYNIFVQSHQSELSDAYQTITTHFARLYGSAGEQQRDAYITDLANAQSIAGMQQGAAFCNNVKLSVLQALALHNADEISRFAVQTNVVNPYSLPVCRPI